MHSMHSCLRLLYGSLGDGRKDAPWCYWKHISMYGNEQFVWFLVLDDHSWIWMTSVWIFWLQFINFFIKFVLVTNVSKLRESWKTCIRISCTGCIYNWMHRYSRRPNICKYINLFIIFVLQNNNIISIPLHFTKSLVLLCFLWHVQYVLNPL